MYSVGLDGGLEVGVSSIPEVGYFLLHFSQFDIIENYLRSFSDNSLGDEFLLYLNSMFFQLSNIYLLLMFVFSMMFSIFILFLFYRILKFFVR
ncbi:hypothetical protein [Candidatus Pelagibacter communis]|uniref:Uncharacterized protein n=1 Tax=Candidatus Epulonipiscium fishelsonii TaxID=77094 RepID=A0ACC8XFG6_9FIRM|nr:hypothetical protein [Candidatus Pelagibacter ubique]ONI42169.1 hypothetical protein AN396_02275 [Epulopiscium sp. SCG-B11WGA-EpuloA1]ONI43417.1 hypothetical protein AN639_02120 [Epulopiscium sp. SCG-B05WGA-EpuloA1]ONI48380.1 hypothetical protein AN643_01700 [Epulopiscium sp. SCG-B10WGA-EpuloB]